MSKSIILLTVFLSFLLAMPVPAGESTDTSFTAEQEAFFSVLESRRSVRSFTDQPVPKAHLMKILDLARLAPTSGNQQPWTFLVIQSRERKDALKTACIENGMKRIRSAFHLTQDQKKEKIRSLNQYYDTCFSAPLFVVVLTDGESKYPSYNHYDGPLAAANLMLAARALGYGTVFYTDSIPEEITRTVLDIPQRYERVCITPIGVPSVWPDSPSKKNLQEMVIFEHFPLDE